MSEWQVGSQPPALSQKTRQGRAPSGIKTSEKVGQPPIRPTSLAPELSPLADSSDLHPVWAIPLEDRQPWICGEDHAAEDLEYSAFRSRQRPIRSTRRLANVQSGPRELVVLGLWQIGDSTKEQRTRSGRR